MEWMFSMHTRPGEIVSQSFDATVPTDYWLKKTPLIQNHETNGVLLTSNGVRRKSLSLYDDPLDYFVYRKAQQIFRQRLMDYKLRRFPT